MIGAFLIGFVGSLHCVGMCGPIMITFVGPRQSSFTFLFYHVGRIFSYMLLGLMLGLLGASLHWFQFQQWVTILLGIALLVIYLIPKVRNRVEAWYFQSALYRYVQRAMASNLSLRKRWFLSGMANGFLPCGLTYVAAAGAVAVGGWQEGLLFMLAFGLGTVPALAVVAASGHLAGRRFKQYLPKAVPFIAILSGGLLLLRGLLMTFPDFQQMVRTHAVGLITVCGL